jgi:two-component system, cell cycle response regulator DivK
VPIRALVAEDHLASAELARYLLEFDGFEVVCAADGQEALALATSKPPDVVVIDLDLPIVDGCEVRDRLAADPALSKIPVVAVSVYEIGEFCPDHGPQDFAGYMRKPVEPTTFAEQVRSAITKSGAG